MGWIKRNLFFVIGGVIALILLGGSGFYIYQGLSRNSTASGALNEAYTSLKALATKNPGPGNDTINNTEIAKEQEKQIRDWISSASGYFQPIPSIPPDPVTSETFAAALRRTVSQLQKDANAANVALPPKYDFSFAAQEPIMQFEPESLPLLAVQLGEVKAIAEIFFSARVNALDGIQRSRVSGVDISGPQGDYTDKQSLTNELTIVTPYVISFRSFSPEIASVIGAFAASSNAFIIKSINVEPASAGAAGDMSPEGANGMPGMPPPGAGPEGYRSRYGGYPGRFPGGYPAPGQQPPNTPPVTSKGGLQTVLKEQLLRITIEVDLVKMLPKS